MLTACRASKRLSAPQDLRRALDHFEQAPEEAVGELRDNNGAGLGKCLEARSQVRRVPDDSFFLGGTGADEIADHHQSGRDPDAGRERLGFPRGQG